MNKYGVTRDCVLGGSLIIAMAISPLVACAQSTPVAENAATENAAAGGAQSRPLSPSPIGTSTGAYTRPTEREKLRLFAFDAFGPYPFAYAALAAGFQQANN